METKTKTRTEDVLTVMTILAWVAFVGFLIDAGAILFSYGISILTPDAAKDLYKGLNLSHLKQFSFWYYTQAVSLIVTLLVMKSLISFRAIQFLSSFNLRNPFTVEVSLRLEKIAYLAFGTWVVTIVSDGHMAWLMKKTGEVDGSWRSGDFIFMVGLLYIISQVFKRGVEIQAENELTI